MSTNNTRDKILDLGKNYMQTIGYHSFNYKMIANQLNIKNASIHHYFPSKEDLALAIIEKATQDFNTWANNAKTISPTERAEIILDRYIQTFNDGKKLCLMSTFESAFNDVSENIRKATSAYVNSVFNWLIDVFKEGLQSKEFLFKESAEEMAVMWLAGLPGSLLVGRTKGAEYFHQIINRLRNSIKGK
jgi:TetR/AcrR family transcriptional repressor of nem operon